MHRALPALAFVLSGCDVLFQLEPVERPVEADAAAVCGAPDEDGDEICDDDDVCAGIADPDQGDDTDRDGVGNACDPNQSVSQRRLQFFGMTDPATDAMTWLEVDAIGTWQFQSGEAMHASATQRGELQLQTINAEPDVTVEAGFTFHAWRDGLNDGRLGISIDSSAGTDDGHTCALMAFSNTDNTTLDGLVPMQAGAMGYSAKDIPALVDGDQVVVFGQRLRSPDVLHCRVLVNGVEVTTAIVPATLAWPAAGRVGVRATFASASLRYVAVYVAP